jgi:hypothetical protein
MRALHVLAAGIAGLLISGCAVLRGPDAPSETLAGVYHARLPAPDASARIITLWLEGDGTATLETVYVGKGKTPVERGRWSLRGDDVIVDLLYADEEGARNETLVFTRQDDRLVPKAWNHQRYGDMSLPLTRRVNH